PRRPGLPPTARRSRSSPRRLPPDTEQSPCSARSSDEILQPSTVSGEAADARGLLSLQHDDPKLNRRALRACTAAWTSLAHERRGAHADRRAARRPAPSNHPARPAAPMNSYNRSQFPGKLSTVGAYSLSNTTTQR